MPLFTFKTIDVPAAQGSYVYIGVTGVDSAGNAVGYYGTVDGDGDGTYHGFVARESGNGVTYDPAGSSNTDGMFVTDAGEIYGDYVDYANRYHGFVDTGSGATNVDILANGGTTISGINDAGVIYGSFAAFGAVSGFTDISGSFSIISVAGSGGTSVAGVNMAGAITGSYTDTSYRNHGFVINGGVTTTFDAPGAYSTSVVGISDDGTVVGNFEDSSNGEHGFIYKNGVATAFDVAGAVWTTIYGVNRSGEIVGSYVDGSEHVHGFTDVNGVITSVDVPGSIDTGIMGVNDEGEIFGYFDDQQGHQHGFVARPDHAPVVTAPDFTATHNQDLAAASLFSATDADGDAITNYQFWDSTSDPSSGHFVVGGVAQGAATGIDVSAAQLASTTFQSGSGSDALWVRAFDGSAWGDWTEFHVNAPLDAAPVTTAPDFAATHNQNIAVSNLFGVTDVDGDAITDYQFWDSSADASSGYFVVGGAAQGAAQNIDVSAAQLAGTTFQAGDGSSDYLWVRAFDGSEWGAWTEFQVNAAADQAPVVTGSVFSATHHQDIAVTSLFSVTDADGDAITNYQFWDSTPDAASGHFVVDGVAQGTSQNIDVSAAQLASTSFQSGSGSDDLWMRASDGSAWGAWTAIHVNAPLDTAPVTSAPDFAATHNQDIAVTSLFSVTDADGDAITNYQFWDSTADASSGHFVVGGAAQGAAQGIDVSAAQLASTTFQAGDGSSDALWVRAFDGSAWGDWTEFHVNAAENHAPVATAFDFSATHNQDIAVSNLFGVTDADGDAITDYQFWDSTADASSGHFVVDGVAQGAAQGIDVSAAQRASTTFQSGSGSDALWVRAFDGSAWGDWTEFHVNAPVDQAPVATASDFTATHNQIIPASSLFGVTDADGDAITKYAFWDSTSDPSSGHFVVGGTAQGAAQNIEILAAQLASVTFVAGSTPDDVWVNAFDGTEWGAWKEFHILV